VFPRRFVLTAALVAAVATPAAAQSLGTFTWQLQPYCNVVTVNVTGTAGVYTLEGYDDQCGAPTRAPLTGVATPNPDGSIGFGFTLVTSPGGRGVQVEARVSLAGLSGPWTDSNGHAGTFAFNAQTGGNPRPSGGLGATAVNASQVQLRVAGSCPSGGVIWSINADGSVNCKSGIERTATGAADLSHANGVFMNHTEVTTPQIPWEGHGRRFMWYDGKAALRAGEVTNTQWNDMNVGRHSVAFGFDSRASGDLSLASGNNAIASGQDAIALGRRTLASANQAIAIGNDVHAAAIASVVLGTNASTTGNAVGSFVFGDASTPNSLVSFFPGEFKVRAASGTQFFSNAAMTTGVTLAPNGNAWSSLSDANSKENFRDLDGAAVLAKLTAMPIREWNYKAQDAAVRHVGPTAQDFHAAFGLGEDPLRISTIDADGIALAGVRALAIENAALKRELSSLRAEVARIEGLITTPRQ